MMACSMEIPPRVRRRVLGFFRNYFDVGNTSACAEKSGDGYEVSGLAWKYLRVCGEESSATRNCKVKLEIPPRVRRRVDWNDTDLGQSGNTSACAEKRSGV